MRWSFLEKYPVGLHSPSPIPRHGSLLSCSPRRMFIRVLHSEAESPVVCWCSSLSPPVSYLCLPAEDLNLRAFKVTSRLDLISSFVELWADCLKCEVCVVTNIEWTEFGVNCVAQVRGVNLWTGSVCLTIFTFVLQPLNCSPSYDYFLYSNIREVWVSDYSLTSLHSR